MPALHELQQAFAACLLFDTDDEVGRDVVEEGFTAAERLGIYRNAHRATLTQALGLAYPAVRRLVGDTFFDVAAAQFIRDHPATSAYLNDYGAEFAAYLAAFEPARSLPYLADVARFESALSAAANAIDAPVLEAASLAAVEPACHARIQFEPHPSVRLLSLHYPADDIADAVMSGDAAAMAEVDLSSGPVRLIVHRGAQGVRAQRLAPDAYEFVSRLCSGEPLGHLGDGAPAEAPALIAEQLGKGRLTALRVQRETSA